MRKTLKKTLVLIPLAIFLAAVPLSAASVSIMVIETGLPAESPASRYSAMWESGLMEVLFESGHIVSNAPVTRIFSPPPGGLPKQAEAELAAADEGGMKYFLAVTVNHPVPVGVEIQKPSGVTMYLYDSGTGRKIMEQDYVDNDSKNAKEEYEKIKSAIGEISGSLQ